MKHGKFYYFISYSIHCILYFLIQQLEELVLSKNKLVSIQGRIYSLGGDGCSGFRILWMGQPGEKNSRGEGHREKKSSRWDGIDIHPYRPASAIELWLCRAVLASTKPLVSRVGWNHNHRLELGTLTTCIVTPWL